MQFLNKQVVNKHYWRYELREWKWETSLKTRLHHVKRSVPNVLHFQSYMEWSWQGWGGRSYFFCDDMVLGGFKYVVKKLGLNWDTLEFSFQSPKYGGPDMSSSAST